MKFRQLCFFRKFECQSEQVWPKKGNDLIFKQKIKPCGKCGHFHGFECLVGTNACFRYGKIGHMVQNCPQLMNKAKTDAQPRTNANVAAEPPERNQFCVQKGREEKGKSAHVVTGMLHVFTFPVYALVDSGYTLS